MDEEEEEKKVKKEKRRKNQVDECFRPCPSLWFQWWRGRSFLQKTHSCVSWESDGGGLPPSVKH